MYIKEINKQITVNKINKKNHKIQAKFYFFTSQFRMF